MIIVLGFVLFSFLSLCFFIYTMLSDVDSFEKQYQEEKKKEEELKNERIS